MKNLFILVFLSAFSIQVFGQQEGTMEQVEEKVSEKVKDSDEKEEAKSSETKETSEETNSEEKKVSEEILSDKKQVPEEAQQGEQGAEEIKPVVEEKSVKETSAVVNEESESADSGGSVQMGVNYECDGGRTYILHEPGVDSESHLCELDAGHTEDPADWYALNQASFCREKLQEIIAQYNCVIKK